ncbi:MAG: DnaJ domain-containing protein [Brevinematales bacterium]|nr:DnaJ domain-containing protein [Brevinematales bacterium]
MDLTKNYYEILGLKKNATIDEIKKNYRKLVLKYHPDVSRTKETENMFRLINEAYSILSNPQLREKYDKKLSKSIDTNQYDLSPLIKVIDKIKENINIVVKSIQKVFDDISSDKFLEKLSNEELLQRLYFSDNELMKIAALKVIKQRKKKSVIPYLLEIKDRENIPIHLKNQIVNTLKELGYKNI